MRKTLYKETKTTGCEMEDGSDTRKTESTLILVNESEEESYQDHVADEAGSQDYSYQFNNKAIITLEDGDWDKVADLLEAEGKIAKAESEEYNGWTNRETWAVKLHWDNNQGDYESLIDRTRQMKKQGKSPYNLASELKEYAEEAFNMMFEGQKLPEQTAHFINDVGSLWRVNWK